MDKKSFKPVMGKRKQVGDDGDDDEYVEDARGGQAKYIKIEDDDDDDDDLALDLDLNGDGDEPGDDTYSERKERFPELAAYDSELADIKAALSSTVKDALAILQDNHCESVHIEGFERKAVDLLEVPRPQPVKIALLGGAGEGKSSLLNSLTDIPGLARSGAIGNTCTCVATEYGAAFQGQEKKYAAKIKYYDLDTIGQLLTEHVNSYLEFTYTPDKHWTEEERLENGSKATTALKTFLALFCQEKGFKNEDGAKKFLEANKDSAKEVASQMYAWAQGLLKANSEDGGQRLSYQEADDDDGYEQLIDPLLFPVSHNKHPALWPIIRHVTIGVKGSRVLEHITIADLPGITDTNQAKVNATHDHLRTCDGLWIVTGIGRAIEDTTVNGMYRRYEERFRGKIAIICTQSDNNVNKDLARGLKEINVDLKEYRKCESQIKQVTSELSKLNITYRSRMLAQNTEKRAQKVRPLLAEITKLMQRRGKLQQNEFSALVVARNQHVTRGLKRELAGRLEHKPDLLVFCVSNTHYLNLKDGINVGPHQLSAEQTEVLALRSYALSLAAPGILQAVEDHVHHRLTVFLKSLELWAISRHVKGGTELLELVDVPHATMSAKLISYQATMPVFIKDTLKDALVRHANKHADSALAIFEKKREERHWSTIKAFMRKNGKYKTSACPQECWNEQFLETAAKELSPRWQKLIVWQAGMMESMQKDLTKEVKGMLKGLKGQEASRVLDMNNFEQMLKGHETGILNAFRDHQAGYAHEMKNLKLDATQDRGSGFFTQAMGTAYEQCKLDSGPGTVERSSRLLKDHLSKGVGESPFAIAATNMSAALVENGIAHATILQTSLDDIFRDVHSHFDGMIDSEVAKPAEQPAKRALKDFLKRAKPEFEQALKDLERIKRKYAATE